VEFDRVLGLGLAEWQPATEQPIPAEIQALAEQRQAARAAKNWAEADALRDQIATAGFDVTDTPTGPELKRRI
jgi:cysteinyl-tRNA synthetase